jgi:hypothetical protein
MSLIPTIAPQEPTHIHLSIPDKNKDEDKKSGDYQNSPTTAMEIIEKELNIADGVIIISTLSGIARIFVAIAQFFWAVINSVVVACGGKSIVPDGENYYKHAALNLFRGFVATIPILGSLLLKTRDNQEIRSTYNNELSRASIYRLLDDQNNNAKGHLDNKEHEDTELSSGGFSPINDVISQFNPLTFSATPVTTEISSSPSTEILSYIEKNLPCHGILRNSNGFIYVDLDDQFIHELNAYIEKEGFEKPPYFGKTGLVGAHITLMYPYETKQYGIKEMEESGEKIVFTPIKCQVAQPTNWKGIDEVYFIVVDAPQLDQIREKYGLPKQDHDFHITIGIKRKDSIAV